jgi:DeoR family transcriptional regulator, aga operon transcriptional repressor
MQQAERLNAILERLSGDGSLSVPTIARELRVSTATIRRDLHHLEQQRLLSRTHGGAVSQGVLYELPLHYKTDRRKPEKRRIATAAAQLVGDASAVGLTGGTTTTEVARALVALHDLTVVTNALNIASELAVRPSVKLVVTGGVARSESYELVGPFAKETLARIYLDVAFIGADGVSVNSGLTTHHEVEADTNLSLIDRSRRVVVVADSSKIGRVTFAQICPLERVHQLITDADADPEALAELSEAGVEITVV